MTARPSASGAVLPVLLLLAVFVFFAAIAASPYWRLSMLDESIARNQDKLVTLRQQISKQAELRQENKALAALGQETDLLLDGGTTGIAGANLQKLMNDLVLRHGGAASSFQLLPPQEEGTLMRIAMSLSVSVGIDGLRNILYDIETGAPLIFIDGITVRQSGRERRVADPHFLGPFDVNLRVSGFVLNEKMS